MTPLDRLDWAAAAASDKRLRASAYRVAPFLAKAFDQSEGHVAYSTEKIAACLGIARSTAQDGIYALRDSGFLRLKKDPSRGRNATEYELTYPDGTDRASGRLTDRESGQLMPQPTDQPTDQPTGHDTRYQGNHGDHGNTSEIDPDTVGPMFTLKNGRGWKLTAPEARRFAAAFPDLDVGEELARAALWCDVNPMRRKTLGGMPRFLHGWLKRAVHPSAPGEANMKTPKECSGFTAEQAALIIGGPDAP